MATRWGSRYGRKLREKVAAILVEKNQKDCPYCKRAGVSRIAVGIWNCRKCKMTFTGKAYSPNFSTSVKTRERKVEEIDESILNNG